MSTDQTGVDNSPNDKEGYPGTESEVKGTEEVSAYTGEDKTRDQGSDKQGDEQNSTVEQAPEIPIQVSKVEEGDEDEDEDDSDDDGFPRSEDAARGRVVGPVAGQRPPKPR